ncbi:hypothetical protein ACOMHN_001253 [Nucella lapillus]
MDGLAPHGTCKSGLEPHDPKKVCLEPHSVWNAALKLHGLREVDLEPYSPRKVGLEPHSQKETGLEPPGVRTSGPKPSGVRTAGLEPPGMRTAGLEPPDVRTAGLEPPDVKTAGLETPDRNIVMASRAFLGAVPCMLVLLAVFDPTQAQSSECQLTLTTCVLPLQNVELPTTSADFQNLCRNLSRIVSCLKALDSDCRNTDDVQKVMPVMEFLQSYCYAITAEGKCYEAIDCFTKWLSQAQPAAETKCSDVLDMLTCMQNKTRDSDQCTIDESKMSFATVKNLTANMCKLDKSCAEADKCIKLPDYPDVSVLSQENPDLSKLKPITFRLTNPGFYCRLWIVVSECYASHQFACGFSDQYVAEMKKTHANLKDQCPAGSISLEDKTSAPSGKGGRLVPDSAICLLVPILLLLAFLRSLF